MVQSIYQIPTINKKATKKEVESLLDKYRMYLVSLPSDKLPSITPSYSIIPPSFTNEFRSSTESTALDRVAYETERNQFLKRIHDAVAGLKPDERFIIYKKYMEQDIGYDVAIWTDLGIGKTKYYEVKGAAILRLAFNLKVEVYKTRKGEKSA